MRTLLILLNLLLISFSAAAQEATTEPTSEGWPIVQRCITVPSEPPQGWTFEGTIFTYSDGVHGYRADWPSRYYVAFESDNEFAGAGTFSPDGRWYALPRGRTGRTSMTFTIYHVIEGLRVVSTAPDRIIYDIPWDGSGLFLMDYRPLWLDNHNIEYAGNQLVLFESSEIQFSVTDDSSEPVQVPISSSPDSSRGIYYVEDQDYEAPNPLVLLDSNTHEQLADFSAENSPLGLSTTTYFGVSQIGWFSDSSHFVASGSTDEQNQIAIIDRNGEHVETLLSTSDNINFRVAQNGLLAAYTQRTLHVVDITAREIIDTCIEPTFREFAVSPDGTQVALGIGWDGFVYVLDIEDWAVYRLELAAADVVAWFPSE